MDSLAHDEPTQRVEPGAAPTRDETHPSRPVRSGTLVAPPPPGLVALSAPAADTPWRRPDDPASPPRTPIDHAPPQPVAAAPVSPQPVAAVAVSPQPVVNVPASPQPVANFPVSSQPVPAVPASPQPVGNIPASPQPVADIPASPQPVADIPASPQPVADVSASAQLVGNVPAPPQPVADVPASPQPVASVPASPEPAANAPASTEVLEPRPGALAAADAWQTDRHEHPVQVSAAPRPAAPDAASPQRDESGPARAHAALPDTAPESTESDPLPVRMAAPDGGASPRAGDPLPADLGGDPAAADPEPGHTPGRANPAWLGEPTGRFDLDLPELDGRNPSWLGEPTRRPDPDEPFDQYALPDDTPPAATPPAPAPERPAAPGQLRGARDAVTVELAATDGGHADLPDRDSGLPGPGFPAAASATLAPPPAGHQPAMGGAPHGQAPGIGAPTEAFTMPVQEVPRESWIDPRLHGGRRRQDAAPARKRAKRPRPPRRAGVAMPLLILFGLVAAFFSWVSAEPLWLAVGHGKTGTLTVTSCAGSGLLQRCVGEFATPARDFTADTVSVLGPPGQAEGLSAPARMVGAGSHRAYVTNGTGGLHLRWMVGLSIVLLCSICIVFATGALRLPERHERLAAVGLSFAGPLLITIGFLAATF